MNEKPSTAKIALKWGAITGVALMIFSTLLYVLDMSQNVGISSFLYVILGGGLVLALREFKQLDNNYLSYSDGLGLGALTAAVAGLLSTLYSVIYTTLIDPGIMGRVVDKMRDNLEEQGTMSDEQIDQFVDNMQAFQSPGIQFVFGFLWLVFIGFIFSLVIAAVMRRNKPVFE
ncbi:MAG: DUF4199 domain-containing protein [Bacteroidetes bacterium]|nr:DUF4199 domain-containing protein [Fibrella sp.]